MREPNALISTEALARDLGDSNLQIFDCTTYLEPPTPGSDVPYVAVPARTTFEVAHIPGADSSICKVSFPTTPHACA